MMTSFLPVEEEPAFRGTFTFRRRWANVDWRALCKENFIVVDVIAVLLLIIIITNYY